MFEGEIPNISIRSLQGLCVNSLNFERKNYFVEKAGIFCDVKVFPKTFSKLQISSFLINNMLKLLYYNVEGKALKKFFSSGRKGRDKR
jgi:hypothetical protein